MDTRNPATNKGQSDNQTVNPEVFRDFGIRLILFQGMGYFQLFCVINVKRTIMNANNMYPDRYSDRDYISGLKCGDDSVTRSFFYALWLYIERHKMVTDARPD